MRWIAKIGLAVLAFALAHSAAAETWPARPVRLIVPFPPSGSNDIVARMIGAQLGERLGQQVFVDNRPGAGATIGAAVVAAAAPDGYTLLLISASFVYNPALYKHLPYDQATAFEPVAMLGGGPLALLVTPSLPVASVGDLLALARAKPGQLNYATAGIGSLVHLASELFRIQAKVDMVHVPYKGGAPAMMDVSAGQAQMTFATLIQCLPLMRGGQLKAIAVSGTTRVATEPDLPTIDESGLPGFAAENWWGVMAPAHTPADIVERLHREINAILTSDETRRRFATEGADARPMERAAFARYLATETAKWGEVVKQAGIKAE
ncbi:MAG TPA: tripartite tricarboxylate transporter substrate binding protein [Candidatus Sulfotelmatobacter sp.]|nr:tripartite tricarboxylate transporter substrate binding protein [Candidatus Sulfotelmatobacter sp.]